MNDTNLNDFDEFCEENKEEIIESENEEVEEEKPQTKKGKKTKKSEVVSFDELDMSTMDFNTFMKNQGEEPCDDSGKIIIPTGIQLLDCMLGGGWGTGFCQLVGLPGGGKSALAAKVLSATQKKWPEALLIYADAEESMTADRLKQLGVKNVRIHNGLTVEKIFGLVNKMAAYKEQRPEIISTPSVILWDSIANTGTELSEAEDDPNRVTGLKARILSHRLPGIVKILNKYNICLLAVNQLRDKIDMSVYTKQPSTLKFLSNKQVPGGMAILYNSFQLMTLNQSEVIKDNPGVDVMVKCKLVKNKLFTPNIEFQIAFSFTRGFSNFWTNVELLKTFKRMTAASWYSLKSMPEKKFRMANAMEYYKTNPDFAKQFDADVLEVLKLEFIDKNKIVEYDDSDIF